MNTQPVCQFSKGNMRTMFVFILLGKYFEQISIIQNNVPSLEFGVMARQSKTYLGRSGYFYLPIRQFLLI